MGDQNIFAAVLDKVRAANDALIADGVLPAGIDQSRVVVEPPRDASHGDMATNAAMVLAKEAKSKPRDLAEAIALGFGKGIGFGSGTRWFSQYVGSLSQARGQDIGRGLEGCRAQVN